MLLFVIISHLLYVFPHSSLLCFRHKTNFLSLSDNGNFIIFCVKFLDLMIMPTFRLKHLFSVLYYLNVINWEKTHWIEEKNSLIFGFEANDFSFGFDNKSDIQFWSKKLRIFGFSSFIPPPPPSVSGKNKKDKRQNLSNE